MTKGPLVGWFDIGDEKLPSYIRIIISHEIRIPINQPGFHGKYPSIFCVAQPRNGGSSESSGGGALLPPAVVTGGAVPKVWWEWMERDEVVRYCKVWSSSPRIFQIPTWKKIRKVPSSRA